jgi:hypothetical protein
MRGTDRASRRRVHRFDFMARFYDVFRFILEHLLDSILHFRDDVSGAASA